MKARDVLIIIFIIALIVVAFLWFRRGGSTSSLFSRQSAPSVPVDLQAIIPPGWQVQDQPRLQCDFDGDGQLEQLLVYRYNSTTLPQPLAKSGSTATYAPFGGVIYDTQPATLKPQPDSPGPYRASQFVPYKLLPDFYPGKGQGYLGETSVNFQYAPPVTAGAGCKTNEVNVYGFSGGALPTRLSVFRWAGTDAGYQVAAFAGDGRVESAATTTGQINSATTYNRLQNHRSILCDVQGYVRPNLDVITFIPNAAIQTIDFCFGPPPEPFYPEGVVVNVLRAAPAPANSYSPNYILDNAQLPPELQFLRDPVRKPVSILTLGNPSSVTTTPALGAPCTTDQIRTADKDALWCGRDRVRVETRITLDGVARDAVWILISVIPNTPNADLYWRVEQVELS
jgi:hypothetical protein